MVHFSVEFEKHASKEKGNNHGVLVDHTNIQTKINKQTKNKEGTNLEA